MYILNLKEDCTAQLVHDHMVSSVLTLAPHGVRKKSSCIETLCFGLGMVLTAAGLLGGYFVNEHCLGSSCPVSLIQCEGRSLRFLANSFWLWPHLF